MRVRFVLMFSALFPLAACQQPVAVSPPTTAAPDLIAKGEYLVKIGGCNDCHTAGYGESGGKVPRQQWLTGSSQGFLGPWGTTYPSNLRLSMSKMSEADWLTYSSSFHTRPPMPDFTIRDMSEEDRRALYRFVTSLGSAGEEAPAYLPPGQQPPAPYFQLVLPTGPAETAKPDAQAAKAHAAS